MEFPGGKLQHGETPQECLKQEIREDLNFGSMMVGGIKPDSFDHLFVSIQSFNSKEFTEITPPDFYDYIVIDEFHHATAPSYQELLDYY